MDQYACVERGIIWIAQHGCILASYTPKLQCARNLAFRGAFTLAHSAW